MASSSAISEDLREASSTYRQPRDLAAIFHASFHPTQGNVVDWSMKASDDLSLDNLEFSALPSGLHSVDQDIVYFTKNGLSGVCIFRRRKSSEQGHRGFRLSSLGILLAKAVRPRPWRHVKELQNLLSIIHSQVELSGRLQPEGADWEPAVRWFNDRQAIREDLGGAGDWNGWSHEFTEVESDPPDPTPTLHLSHLLRILGPSSLTLYKHVLGRRRILIYTLPPVEAACILCHVAGDICFEDQVSTSDGRQATPGPGGKLKGRSKEPISVLGMITLNDLDRLRAESATGRGWVACTTDAIFLEKPSHYDLLIDLTTAAPNKATRPMFYASKPVTSGSSKETHKLSTIRFAWSDVRLWNEIERILQLDTEQCDNHCCGHGTAQNPDIPLKPNKSITAWTDAWRVYEDVCLICAGLWIGSSSSGWRTRDVGAENWGAIRLDGDDVLKVNATGYVRNVGMGIEGRPTGASNVASITKSASRRSKGLSWTSGRQATAGSSTSGKQKQPQSATQALMQLQDTSPSMEFETLDPELDAKERRDVQLRTTLALLQTFHAHTLFQLSVLESIIPATSSSASSSSSSSSGTSSASSAASNNSVTLGAKEILAFELGPLSGSDARYLDWLAQEYASGTKVVVKRGWKDLFSAILGYG
ncbi:hypothetical protein BDN72DRAFT_841243 [Pluteus cervinus]|uniref:Uncharacterized protein n=1 Tax=Pluteus cervinus TaxID=181527 RepID=A0ACD3ATG4_9AGAR|nr:hypothetical protein BDN72DRAFT_841243 [Pluteus cervinus]